MSEHPERSEAGDPILRHQAPVEDLGYSFGDPEVIAAVSDHIERHLGPVEQVFHEIISPGVHVDIHWVTPTGDLPWHTLVTSGMGEKPMNTPAEAASWRYAELLVSLPTDWPISTEAFEDENHYWPVRWLKQLARLPHEYNTWLGYGHTIPNGDPPEPFAPSTALAGMILVPPVRYPREFFTLEHTPDHVIHFWSLVPLYREEMELKLRKGSDELLDRFDREGIAELINPVRPNVAAHRNRWWTF